MSNVIMYAFAAIRVVVRKNSNACCDGRFVSPKFGMAIGSKV